MNVNLMDEVNRNSLLTQGVTTGFLSQYLYQTYVTVLPWLIPCIPLIIIVCKYGRLNAKAKGEEVTWLKTIKMAINKTFNYICWIMIACTLSIAFDCTAITILIMAIVYGLEVLKCILRFVQSHGHNVSERQAVAIFLQIIIGRITGNEFSAESIINNTEDNGKS